MKWCKTCDGYRDESLFYKVKTNKDGLQQVCKKCDNARRNKRRQNPVNRKKDSLKTMKYHKTEKGIKVLRREQLKSRYGITLEQYDAMLVRQNYVCAICKQPETRKFKDQLCPLSVDHNHVTGKVRALLCNHCNHLLGDAMSDKEILLQAVLYLEQYSG